MKGEMKMRNLQRRLAVAAIVVSLIALANGAVASTLITDFDSFSSGALYGAWATGTVVSGPTSYDITATGYGSNWKYIGWPVITGAGNSLIELTVTLQGPTAADGHLGPIVQLIDGDGTHYNYAWYGQTLGSHVLTKGVESPTWVSSAGGTAGLDLNTLTHMHMALDPGGFGASGAYTIKWENLALTNPIPEPSTILLGLVCLAGLGFQRR
jgi:hypothetical protein